MTVNSFIHTTIPLIAEDAIITVELGNIAKKAYVQQLNLHIAPPHIAAEHSFVQVKILLIAVHVELFAAETIDVIPVNVLM